MEILCSACGAALVCQPEGGCWCMALPHVLAVPETDATGCLCRDCLLERTGQPPSPEPV